MEERTSFQITDPYVTSSDYDYMKTYWDMHDDVMGGTRTMREAGVKYLHKQEAETNLAWKMRLERTTLFNVLSDSIENVVSRPFAKPIIIGENVNKKIAEWAEDIDTRGTSLHNFMAAIFDSALNYGFGHILADYPTRRPGMTLADARRAGHRPYLIHLPTRNVIGIYEERLNGKQITSHLRIEESFIRFDRKTLNEEEVIRIKIIEPDLFQVYERVVNVKTSNGIEARTDNWILKDHGKYTFSEVPLATLRVGKHLGGHRVKPPFTDLAYKNIEHWQGGSDQRHILTRARFAMLAASGVDLADMEKDDNNLPVVKWGPDTLLATADPQGKFYFVEARGTAIASGQTDQESMVEQMRIMGIDPLMPKTTGVITATESGIDEAKSQSRLHKWTYAAEDTCNKALNFIAQWDEIKDPNICTELNKEFGIVGRADDVKLLLELRREREIDRQTLFEELKRRGFLGAKINVEDVEDRLDSEEPDFVMIDQRKKNENLKAA
ncbi:MAG: hypothetical protein DSY80_08795 [Desulfocapsa sp.]|nr:MAG: hypothetical protein DSY80_08795 [Desulfocapsa sp.]